MAWSPEQWQQDVEDLVEKCAQKVLAEIEEEVMGRLKALSKDIIERICLPDLDIAVELDLEDGIGLLGSQNTPLNKKEIKEETKEASKELAMEPGKELWYAFGIIQKEQIVWPLVNGIEDSPCQVMWQDSLFNSEESRQNLNSKGHLGILVCAVPESDYNETALHEHLENIAWVESRVRKHEQVLLETMEITTIIPMPFGTIFRGKDQIESQLISNRDYWQHELTRLAGHYEMQLKLLVDTQKLQRIIEEKLPYSGDQGGGGYFLKRQWKKKLETEKEGLIDHYSESLFGDLNRLTVEAKLLGTEETQASGLKHIFTAQFLLAQESRQAWEELLQAFDQETDSLGFILDIAGPWPTYHFTGLDKTNGLNGEERNRG